MLRKRLPSQRDTDSPNAGKHREAGWLAVEELRVLGSLFISDLS